jgi:hypothetical protein
MRGTKPTADPHPPSPLGLVPPLPHCGRGAFELNTLEPLFRTAGVKELSVFSISAFSISASPAKAGAHRSAVRTDLRWRIAIPLEIPNGGGVGPGFRQESEGNICRLHVQARFLHMVTAGKGAERSEAGERSLVSTREQ